MSDYYHWDWDGWSCDAPVTAGTTCVWDDSQPNFFPAKYPFAKLDYTLNIFPAINPDNDFVYSVAVSAAPSSTGELVLIGVTINDWSFTLTEMGGQPRRLYTLQFIVTMTNGRVCEFLVYQGVNAQLPTDQPQPVATPGFGAPVTAVWIPRLDFRYRSNANYRMMGWN